KAFPQSDPVLSGGETKLGIASMGGCRDECRSRIFRATAFVASRTSRFLESTLIIDEALPFRRERGVDRTAAQVPPASRTRGGRAEDETRGRGDDHPAGRHRRSRGPPRRTSKARGRPLVRSDRPP